jgi:hypothetical protein
LAAYDWVRKERLADSVPTDFASVIDEVAKFADPILDGGASGAEWSPTLRGWE